MIKHTPGTARDLHRNIAEWWATPEATRLCDAWAELPKSDKWYPEVHRALMLAADTYLVTDELSAVCRQAGLSLPFLSVSRGVLPSDVGFIVFNDDILQHDPSLAAKFFPTHAYAWRAGVKAGVPGVWINRYEDLRERILWVKEYNPREWAAMRAASGNDRESEYYEDLLERAIGPYRAPLQPSNLGFIPFLEAIDWETPFHDNADHAWLQMLLAAWLLMDQPLTVAEKPRLARAFTKRAERAGLVSDINVVMLRRPRSVDTGEETESGRQYHSRWIVQGHWRRIPAPEQPHRITWVHGYVKGPADAPLIVRDRVTVLGK